VQCLSLFIVPLCYAVGILNVLSVARSSVSVYQMYISVASMPFLLSDIKHFCSYDVHSNTCTVFVIVGDYVTFQLVIYCRCIKMRYKYFRPFTVGCCRAVPGSLTSPLHLAHIQRCYVSRHFGHFKLKNRDVSTFIGLFISIAVL